ncbi:hypothetical protein ACFRKB_27470 [Streptomyces scopuliridis]|uniref:hypothetical protein n=1 Tax=Streptomyces scopuliridis TaxID=452529 RepID=UPI0036CB7E43
MLGQCAGAGRVQDAADRLRIGPVLPGEGLDGGTLLVRLHGFGGLTWVGHPAALSVLSQASVAATLSWVSHV